MSIESDFFKRKRFVMEQLLAYGFRYREGSYWYSEPFMEGDFEAEICVSEAGQVSGRVLDTALGEEYLALRVERSVGTYIGQVREAYAELLGRIADACCVAMPFASNQANRLAVYLEQTFGDSLEHPFDKYPTYACYRHMNKWYALLFPLTLGKLSGVSGAMAEREADVVNVKVDPVQMETLLAKDGIYPSYHMSKKTWVSVVLDDSLSDAELFELVGASRRLVAPSSLINPNGPDYWIIPANMKDYDIDKDFAASAEVVWTQKASIKAGDVVLIYITAPTKAVRYVCQVLEDHLGDDNRPLMRLKLMKQLTDDVLTFDQLKALGVKAVRGPRRVTAALVTHLNKLIG